ncbi:MAG: biotin/lipoyl-containing protein, partial [Natronospirillum sp.]
MATEIIKVPDIGTSDKVTIIEVSVSVGDTVSEDDTLLVLESDKASMDVPAPMAGKITKLQVSEGDEVGEGDEILYIEVESNKSAESADDSAQTDTEEKAPVPAPAKSGNTAVKTLTVPDIGSEDPVDIIEVHVKAGDTVSVDDPIVTLESDKASMEVPALEAGEVVSVKIKEGDQVKEGDALIEIKTEGGASASAEQAPASASKTKAAPTANNAEDTGAVETVTVPDIGTDGAVDIIEVHVKPGDTLAEDDSIVTLESDKASMDVPTPKAGEVVSVKVEVGNEVKQGDILIEIKTKGSATAPAPQAQAQAQASQSPAPAKQQDTAPATAGYSMVTGDDDEIIRPSKPVHAGPAVRLLARELGVDLALVKGSGPQDRILKQDVAGFVKTKIREPERVSGGAGIAAVPDQDFSKFGAIEEQAMSRIQQLTAANMTRN